MSNRATGRHPSPASTERRKLRLCPFICYRYGSTRGQKIESMKFRQWVGRVAFVSIAWLALPIQSAVQAADFLYHERFAFVASDGVRLGAPQYPPGKIKFDETFNKKVLTYRGDVVVRLPAE